MKIQINLIFLQRLLCYMNKSNYKLIKFMESTSKNKKKERVSKSNKKEVLYAVIFAILAVPVLSIPCGRKFYYPLLIPLLLLLTIVVLRCARWCGKKFELKKLPLISLFTLYSVTVVTSVIAATKIIRFDILGFSNWFFSGEMSVPAGVIVYAVSFLITDLISEVYGKSYATGAVLLGFISMVIFSLYSYIMDHWMSASYWEGQEAFHSIVGSSLRITVAGCISFLISQYWDVTIFHWLKNYTESKFSDKEQKLPALWLRNNLSTITSQFIDSTIFISIAFLGIYENKMVINMIIAQWLIKCIIAVIDTPFAYWGRKVLIDNEKKD